MKKKQFSSDLTWPDMLVLMLTSVNLHFCTSTPPQMIN